MLNTQTSLNKKDTLAGHRRLLRDFPGILPGNDLNNKHEGHLRISCHKVSQLSIDSF